MEAEDIKKENILGIVPLTLLFTYIGMVVGSIIGEYVIFGDTGYGTSVLAIIFYPFAALAVQFLLIALRWYLEKWKDSFVPSYGEILKYCFIAGFISTEVLILSSTFKIITGSIFALGPISIVTFMVAYFFIFDAYQYAHRKNIKRDSMTIIIFISISASLVLLYILSSPHMYVLCNAVQPGDSRQKAEQMVEAIKTKMINVPEVRGLGTDDVYIDEGGTACSIEFQNDTVMDSVFHMTYL